MSAAVERNLADRLRHLEVAFEQLRAENARLQAENARLRADNARLQAENDKLRAELATVRAELATVRAVLAEAERSGKRQAAPFSRNEPKAERKKNGRKAGEKHGKHGHRPVPTPEQFDEIVEAKLPDVCPHCGHDQFDEIDTVDQYQEELPREPLHRKIIIHRGKCRKCSGRVQGRHPLQTSDATGAAAAQVGPIAQAAVVYLNKHAGMSHQKISDTFKKLMGMNISRGACCQIVLRAGQKLESAVTEIDEKIKESEHITPDETGWRVGGSPVWLHAWVGDAGATRFTIDSQRGANALERTIGLDWSGTMTHDGMTSYDRFREASHQQCVDHAMRRAKKLVKANPRDPAFPNRVLEIFQGALEVRDQCVDKKISAEASYQAHEEYAWQLLELTGKTYANEENRKFAKHLHGHGEQWFMFLIDAEVPATNHRAEQALKTPIVNRKVFGGNQTAAGARAQEATSSVLATCKKRMIDAVSFISDSLCGCVASLFSDIDPSAKGR